MSDAKKVECCEHGESIATFVCQHLINCENTQWYSCKPDDEAPWPDSWCGKCPQHFDAEGEWNEESEVAAELSGNIKLLCHHCYERIRSKCNMHFI